MPVFKLCLHILKSRLVSYHSDLKFNANFILLNYFSHIAISSFYRLHVSKPILRNGGGGGVWKIQQSERKVVLGLLVKKRGICSLRPPSAMLIERFKICFVQFQSNDCEFNAQVPWPLKRKLLWKTLG